MITLQDLLTVLDVPTVEVRVDMTSRLTSRVRFQPNNMAQLDDIVGILGRYEVKSIECEARQGEGVAQGSDPRLRDGIAQGSNPRLRDGIAQGGTALKRDGTAPRGQAVPGKGRA